MLYKRHHIHRKSHKNNMGKHLENEVLHGVFNAQSWCTKIFIQKKQLRRRYVDVIVLKIRCKFTGRIKKIHNGRITRI